MDSPAPTLLRVDGRAASSHDARVGTGRFVALATRRSPRLSWVVPLARAGQAQTGFEVRIRRIFGEAGILHVASDDLLHAGAGGDPFVDLTFPLEPYAAWQWQVRVRDEHEVWSDWSDSSRLETGPWTYDEWVGRWLTHPALSTLRRAFRVTAHIRYARLHLAAQGLIRASINDIAVNPDSSDPSRTDHVRALYRSYDVTDLIRAGRGEAGENTLDLVIASGEWARTGSDPRVLAEVAVHLEDGTILRSGTGEGMLRAPSEVVVEEPFYLERHENIGASLDFRPAAAARVPAPDEAHPSPRRPPGEVTPDPGPPIHRVELHRAELLSRTEQRRVYDVGTNIAGRSRLRVAAAVPDGTVIRVIHGEQLRADGGVDTTNLTMPEDRGRVRQAVEYVVSGPADGVLQPWFCYHGFRYIEVAGLPADVDLTVDAWSLHSDLEATGELVTDDAQVNALVGAARRTLLNNVHGIPEDCPTREQSGWTGDTASAAEFDFQAFDMQGFFTKWLGDLRTSQQADGSIPAISPDLRSPRIIPDPVWGAALQRVLIGHWLHYGDVRVVRETLPVLRRWADYQLTLRSDDGVIGNAQISYGSDWLALAQTPPPLLHTYATIDCLDSLATLEEAIGDPGAAAARRAAAAELRAAARAAFVDDARDVVGNGTQAADAIGVESGILVASEIERAGARIADDVKAHGDRVTSGFAATRTVLGALARTGHSQDIFDALHQPAEPGIGAMLDHGPGTFWECWWIDPVNTGTGSLDHIGLGGPFAGWAWQWLAGVRPTGAGWSAFVAEPQFVRGVDSLHLVSRTVRGVVGLDYRVDAGTIDLTLTVPVGSCADLRLPGQPAEELGSGVHRRIIELPVSRTAAAPRGHVEEPIWVPPFRPAPSPDVDGERDWQARSLALGAITGPAAEPIQILRDGIRCMPVPHEQPEGPVVLVRSRRGASRGRGDDALTVRLTPGDDAEAGSGRLLPRARFVYALLDLCVPNPRRALESVMIVHGADGTRAQGVGRLWPAGWNRVSVDVTDLARRTAITAVEVGVRTRGQGAGDSNAGPYDAADRTPLAFHLGEVGYSTRRRTW